MKALLLSLLMILYGAVAASAGDRTPAGYVTEISLAGEDASAKTVIVRDGGEIAAKLMMPVYDGDVVFLREAASRIALETGDGMIVRIGGSVMRFAVTGELDTGDSTWGIIAAIGGVFSGDDEPAPENMVSKGGTLKIPMASRGSNMVLRSRQTLWLAWEGGTAPFTISLADDGGETRLAGGLSGSEAEITLPAKGKDRFTLVVRDAEQQKVQVRLRLAERLPEGSPPASASAAGTLALAAWLTGQGEGTWRIEAAQMLHGSTAAAAPVLLQQVRTGWRYSAPAP